ncbi:TetR/AcrR family transcriptional regulator [Parasphaerochaeta coccoides]|uniref:Regulatory protein TetR n=1 Tax=Parasphaerochaeta coccoides (strain ATCC BAA-1237 / DSM 17374 / SPN1) TaxID=760011 RepID=F4GKR3_PARC1|nr:TetR/AcrR family transcriptional regulator [Parasphaerochaeta coccoides]AEC01472.1 regulatory protein TetR [Parasphaerochaeta coccoides DSM 17374]
MPKKIDHEERKKKILQTALKVFAREGYKDSNLSLIAEESGISRPTLYQYFKDKEQIYYYAVKLVTSHMFAKYADYAWSNSQRDTISKIVAICDDIIDVASHSVEALTNLVDVMLQIKKEGRDFSSIIMRRTAKLNILFKRLLRRGIHDAHDVIPCDIDKLTSHLITLLQAFCFQLAFLETADTEEFRELVANYLEFFKTHPLSTSVVPRS